MTSVSCTARLYSLILWVVNRLLIRKLTVTHLNIFASVTPIRNESDKLWIFYQRTLLFNFRRLAFISTNRTLEVIRLRRWWSVSFRLSARYRIISLHWHYKAVKKITLFFYYCSRNSSDRKCQYVISNLLVTNGESIEFKATIALNVS